MATMGERLKASRKRLGWMQVDLAAKTGVGLATIRRIEQEAMEPRMGTTRKLAAALGRERELAGLRGRRDGDRRKGTGMTASRIRDAGGGLRAGLLRGAGPGLLPGRPGARRRRLLRPPRLGRHPGLPRRGPQRPDRQRLEAPRLRRPACPRRGRPLRRGRGPQARPLRPQPPHRLRGPRPPGPRPGRLRLHLRGHGPLHRPGPTHAHHAGGDGPVLLRQPLPETKKGKAERKRQGMYNGHLPFGTTKGPDGVPVLDTEARWCDVATRTEVVPADGLRLAFELAAAGKSDREIARALNAAGHRTSGNRGHNPLSKDTVRVDPAQPLLPGGTARRAGRLSSPAGTATWSTRRCSPGRRRSGKATPTGRGGRRRSESRGRSRGSASAAGAGGR